MKQARRPPGFKKPGTFISTRSSAHKMMRSQAGTHTRVAPTDNTAARRLMNTAAIRKVSTKQFMP